MLRLKGTSKAKFMCYKCLKSSEVGHVALAMESGRLIWQSQSDMPSFGLRQQPWERNVLWKLGYDKIHFLDDRGNEVEHYPGAIGIIHAVCPECWEKE